MLFHIAATHTPDNCALYHPDLHAKSLEYRRNLGRIAAETGVEIRFLVTGAPALVLYGLLETDDFEGLQKVLGSMPIPSEFAITPVVAFEQAADSLSEYRG